MHVDIIQESPVTHLPSGNRGRIGVDFHAGLAEHIVVDRRFVLHLPPPLDSGTAAAEPA